MLIYQSISFETSFETNMSEITIINNRGTGAGGANTNVNGLQYESLTDLNPVEVNLSTRIRNGIHNEVAFEGYSRKFILANKSMLHKYMKQIGELNPDLIPASGCKEPDEAYIETEQKVVFIIEKKFQQGHGSVDEKIQTGHFKAEHYAELFPKYKVHYIYCLSDWFKRDEYKSPLRYLKKHNIPVFWGSSETYKQDVIEFMHNSLQ